MYCLLKRDNLCVLYALPVETFFRSPWERVLESASTGMSTRGHPPLSARMIFLSSELARVGVAHTRFQHLHTV